jgi:ABC-2 type transport system permease protein
MAYRASMISRFIAVSMWTALTIVTMLLITDKAKVVAGWTQGEMLLITGGLLICLGLFELHFKRSFQQLPDTIFHGNLDNLLLKPVDSQFMISFIQLNIMALWRITVGFIFLFYVLQRFSIAVTLERMVLFVLLLFVGLAIYYCLWLLAATTLVWFPRLSNILDVMNSMNHASRFPPDMYREFSTFIFLLILPYMFITATPVKVLLQKATLFDILGLLTSAVILFFVSRKFWQYSLRYYTSASG